MDQPPKRKQRIVSKSQYVQALSKRLGLTSMGCGLMILTYLCGVTAIFLISPQILGGLIGFAASMGFGLLACALGKWSFDSFRRAKTIDPGVPLTQKVVETLPAEESLVRASEEPTQTQQAILLRAATPDDSTPSEQLVRPTGEQEP